MRTTPSLLLILGLFGCTSVDEKVWITEFSCRTHQDCEANARCNVVLGQCVELPPPGVGEPCDRRTCDTGTQLVCLPADQDPSGVARCRSPCTDATCTDAALRCLHTATADVCVPKASIDGTCIEKSDCQDVLICVIGEPGAPEARRCRATCEPDSGAPGCPRERLCASLDDGGGGCIVDPCASVSCSGIQACDRMSALEARCIDVGRATGTFSTQLSTNQAPKFGTSGGTISAPGVPSYSPTDGALAVLTMIDGEEHLLLALFGNQSSSGFFQLLIAVPSAGLMPHETIPVGWTARAQLEFKETAGNASLRGVGTSGELYFERVSTTEGNVVAGTFDLALGAPAP